MSAVNNLSQAAYRILDASANRASEGFRTLEDFARFVLDDREATESLKQLRHRLAGALKVVDREKLLRSRDTPGDVGTDIQNESEYVRENIVDVVTAAASRLSQSLRVIEEYAKMIDGGLCKTTESIRYQTYSIAGGLELSARQWSARDQGTRRKEILQQAKLYALIDAGKDERDLENTIRSLTSVGVTLFQLRDKDASDRILYRRAAVATSVARANGALLIVNDRADIALAADADGVHVGQSELPFAPARSIVGVDRIIGVSTHNTQHIAECIDEGVDYIGCGPVFDSRTKSFPRLAGLDFLKAANSMLKPTALPAFAIGGIDAERLDDVLATGFHRIAVTGAIRDAEDPTEAARTLIARLNA